MKLFKLFNNPFKERTLSPEAIAERDRLADEFLSIWVESFKVTTETEMKLCFRRTCEVYDKIMEIDPEYSLDSIDYYSTGYTKPSRCIHSPVDLYSKQIKNFRKKHHQQKLHQEKRQKSLARLRRVRKS